ncbi:MAG TPA: ATP phosphoribosyltransferase regulatory subunit [Candidatus Dormibacteraeota bacterium]|nr:ATP phosphoribosyltransferase regulatory subunit [Candidatus Dormibacteraeota bacterium]
MQDAPTVEGAGAPRGRAGGFTDWLPGAARRRRTVGDAMIGTFEAWGYGMVATPLVEPLDTVSSGVGPARQTQLFRFMDGDGGLLALVGERTVSVARVVATQLRDGPYPLRLCYAGPVLRNHPSLGGRRRETLQAGCELIGAACIAADAECVALAAEALARAGLDGVQVDVGHADFLPGLLEGVGLDASDRDRVLAALSGRDLVAVEEALEGTPIGEAERGLLLRFPALRGGREILDAAALGLRADRPRHALGELAQLWDLLQAHGLESSLHLDLGAVRDWDYYTGPTFELFSGELGFPLGTGGRYDGLLGRFGLPLPATGFVLHVDRCCDALARRGGEAAVPLPPALRVAYAPGGEAMAIRAATALRGPGTAVACDLEPSQTPSDGADLFVDADGGARWWDGSRWADGSTAEAVAALADGGGDGG